MSIHTDRETRHCCQVYNEFYWHIRQNKWQFNSERSGNRYDPNLEFEDKKEIPTTVDDLGVAYKHTHVYFKHLWRTENRTAAHCTYNIA